MANETCILEIEKLAGRELTSTEKEALSKQVDNWVAKHEFEKTAGDLTDNVMAEVEKWSVDLEAAAIIEKRNASLNALKKFKTQQYIESTWADDPAEGLKAVLGESLSDRYGAKNGLTATIASNRRELLQGMTAEFAKKDLMKVVSSGKLDKEIAQAMYHINQAVLDDAAIAKMLPEAVEAARIFSKYMDIARNQSNKAGSWIKKLEGRFARRTHDEMKISKAAGTEIPTGDPRHRKAWVDYLSDKIDWEKTMPDVAPDNRIKVLDTMFTQMSNGYHVKFKPASTPGFKGALNIGKKLSHERVLHFKDFEAEWEYYSKFSRGESLVDNIIHEVNTVARDTAIMQRLGPNAEANLDATVDKMLKSLTKKGEGEKAKNLKDMHEKLKAELWPAITEEMNIPQNATFAKWSQLVRNIEAVGDLAAAAISSIADLAYYGSTMRYIGDRTTGNVFSGMYEALRGVFGDFRKITPEIQELASEMGVLVETMIPHASRFDADINNPGDISRWTQRLMKLNLLSDWQDRVRLTAVVATGHRHALKAGKAFKDLPAGMQALFRQYGIEDWEWDLIRKQNPKMDPRGRQIFTTETIDQIPESSFPKAKMRDELKTKYRNLFSEIGTTAATEPGKIERAWMLRGTKRGTLQGEILRHFWMYKSFMVSVMRKHLGRELHGYHPDRVSTPQALMRMFKNPSMDSGFGGMVNMMAMSTLLGYAAMELKNITKGKTPRQPEEAKDYVKLTAAAMSQGGSMGIYGDFLFGQMKSRFGHSGLETFFGPTVGRAADLMDIWTRFVNGDDAAAKAFWFALNNTPGVNTARNLFYTRWAMDYLLTYRLQEMMNPGYLKRMERKLKKEKQQEFLIPPSSVIPRGGF